MKKNRLGLLLLALGLLPGTTALAKGGGKQAPPPAPSANAQAAESYTITHNYVHDWIALPELVGTDLKGQELRIKPQPGFVEVITFVASSCVACQELIPPLQALAEQYANRNARFTYVFSHDTPSDANAFASRYGLTKTILASHDLLKTYHDPPLPCIYVGDRHGWLNTRFCKAKRESFAKLKTVVDALVTP